MNTSEIQSKFPNRTANRRRLVRKPASGIEPALLQEPDSLASLADQLASPSTPWPAALAILSSPDIMTGLLRERLPESVSNGLVLTRCHPKILKKRLGSRQVIAYGLDFLNEGDWRARSLRVVAKRYANGAEGERAFHIMETLWQAGFCEGDRLRIPRPLCYLADFRLLIQERARGSLLPAYLSSGDGAARDRMEMVAR